MGTLRSDCAACSASATSPRDPPATLQVARAGAGECDGAGGSLQEPGVETLLERGHEACCRRGGNAHATRCGREAAKVGNGHEKSHRFQAVHVVIATSAMVKCQNGALLSPRPRRILCVPAGRTEPRGTPHTIHERMTKPNTTSRIATPASAAESPAASQPLLEAVNKQLGLVPNLFRVVGNSPSALEGFLGLSGALSKGRIDARTRERIALAVAEANGCDYCLSAHTYLGKNLAKLEDTEMAANREGGSSDPNANAAVRFAAQIVRARGHVTDSDVRAVKEAGYDDAQVVEIVLHVALNTLTNYVNEVAKTAIDFPVVVHRSK